MDNPPVERTNRVRKGLIVSLVLIVVLAALGGFFLWNQSHQQGERKLVPPTYKKVAADATHDIAILIKNDTGGMYFEWNGKRLSRINRITGLAPGTQYTFTITNNTLVKEGIFIPALTTNLVINAGQSSTASVSFASPGTYYFLGNIYQAGWAGLESGFDVGQ
jgi:heme/copper-type cytochrome/quinol oxidase subunit 2